MSNGVLYGASHDMVYHDRVYHGVSSCLMVCFMVRLMIWCIMIVCIMVSHHV